MKKVLLFIFIIIGSACSAQAGWSGQFLRNYVTRIHQTPKDSIGADKARYITWYDKLSTSFYTAHLDHDTCDAFYICPANASALEFMLSMYNNTSSGYVKISDTEWRNDAGKESIIMKTITTNKRTVFCMTVVARR
jgi:hypothetical protein